MHLVETAAGERPVPREAEPELSPAKEGKSKLRAAWISFFGRIVAQVIGATATLALGILLAGRLHSVSLEAARPATPSPPAPLELSLALLDVREAFVLYDRDHDGVLVAAELPQPVWQALRASDADADGALSKDELYEARERARATRRR